MSDSEFCFHKEHLNEEKIKLISFISFLLGFGQAVLIYILSTYFKNISGTENVGVFYLVAYAIELIILLNFHKVVAAYGRSRAFLFILLCKIPIILLLVFLPPNFLALIPLILYLIAGSLAWVALDMILESCSTDRFSGRIRGLHLTIMNTGYVFGPLLSTRLLDKFGFHGIFIFLIILYSFIFLFALLGLRNLRENVKYRPTIMEILKKVSLRKNVLRAYYISFVLEFFYALMVIYTPIYLRNLGLGWDQIGIVFTVMLVPFVLFQYPAGLIADKKTGEKELIIFSLIVMAIATFSVYFISSTSVAVWALVLFATRIGASLVEILRDSYFYKRIESTDIDVIDFFRTSRAAAYIAAAIISTPFLFIFPLKSIFLLTALVAFSALYPAFRLVDNRSEREIRVPPLTKGETERDL
ncbi:MAG: MFS transporter [Candidatus Moranbacteria bacterium]|nr:MFS transporter [Candidatus Moranbacteria bacterium]